MQYHCLLEMTFISSIYGCMHMSCIHIHLLNKESTSVTLTSSGHIAYRLVFRGVSCYMFVVTIAVKAYQYSLVLCSTYLNSGGM